MIDTICLVGGVDDEDSYSSGFPSCAASCHDDEMVNEFKVFENALYDNDFEDDHPISCFNV